MSAFMRTLLIGLSLFCAWAGAQVPPELQQLIDDLPLGAELPPAVQSYDINHVAEAIVARHHARETAHGPEIQLIPPDKVDIEGLREVEIAEKMADVIIKFGYYTPSETKSVALDLMGDDAQVIINFLPPDVESMGTERRDLRRESEDNNLGLRLGNDEWAERLRPKSGWLYIPKKILTGDGGRDIVARKYGHFGAVLSASAKKRTLWFLGDSLTMGKVQRSELLQYANMGALLRGSLPFFAEQPQYRYIETLTLGDLSVDADVDHFLIYDDYSGEAWKALEKHGKPIFAVELTFSSFIGRPVIRYKRLLSPGREPNSAKCDLLLSGSNFRN